MPPLSSLTRVLPPPSSCTHNGAPCPRYNHTRSTTSCGESIGGASHLPILGPSWLHPTSTLEVGLRSSWCRILPYRSDSRCRPLFKPLRPSKTWAWSSPQALPVLLRQSTDTSFIYVILLRRLCLQLNSRRIPICCR